MTYGGSSAELALAYEPRTSGNKVPVSPAEAPVKHRRLPGPVSDLPNVTGVRPISSSGAAGRCGSAGLDRGLERQAWPRYPSTPVGDTGHNRTRRVREDAAVVIIDDFRLFRENLASTLALKGILVLGVAWDLPSMVAVLDLVGPAIIVLNMATRGSLLILRAAANIGPDRRIIALGVSEDDETELVACAEAGVAGYHMRSESLEDLLELIADVAGGQSISPSQVSAVLLRRLAVSPLGGQLRQREPALTARETQILRMLELGRSNQEIAAQLNIAVHTVKNHVHNLLTKLGVSTRAEAAALSRVVEPNRQTRRH